MTSYILQNETEERTILLYQTKEEYSFKPNKKYKFVENITVLDKDMLSSIWEEKFAKVYENLVKLFYESISGDDDTGDYYIPYKEIDRIKEYLLSLEEKGLKKNVIKKYLQKIYLLELEIENLNVYEETESRGHGR